MGNILRLPASWMQLGVITVGALAAVMATASQAIWTDTDVVGSNDFATGSVDVAASPTDTLLSLSLAKPGDSNPTSGGTPLDVQNNGTLDFIYALTVDTTPTTALDTELKLTIRLDDSTNGADATPAAPCDEFDGTVVYGPDLDLVPAGGKLIGDPTTGAQAGDRTLNANTSEFLCFKVTLPSAASNAAQGLSTTANFTFSAEQAP